MGDLIIRGMEMPKTCCQCDLKIYDNEIRWDENGIEQIVAWVCKRTREIIWNTQRGENCPLVPIPEGHGELIDKAEAYDRIEEQEGGNYIDMDSVGKGLEECQIVVPAEGGEEA